MEEVDVVAEDGQLEAVTETMEGRLVEVFGMEGQTAKSIAVVDEAGEPQELEVDGKMGRCLAWHAGEQKYVVETFEGVLCCIPKENLREYLPPPPSQGGFDMVWPEGAESTELFGEMICQEIAAKGYCLIQTFMSPEEREEAVEVAEANGGRPFYRMKQEIEVAFLGLDNSTKVGHLDNEEVEEDSDITNPLEACNRQMSALGLLLAPLSVSNLGFNCNGRLQAYVRVSTTKEDEENLPVESITDEEDSGQWSANVEMWVRFQQRRKLSILCLLANSGGDLWLYPKEGFGPKSVHIPVTENKILIFRHDLMEYSYQATGPSVALQTWVLNDPPVFQQIKEMQVTLAAMPGDVGEVVCNPGPEVPAGPKASVMALTCRLPGESWNPAQYWNMYCSGGDCPVQWPFSRWETEPYYLENGDSNLTGKAYTCHGGFITQEMMNQFDNEFFGIDFEEAKTMLPGQRVSMEVGYQALVASGFTRKSLQGRRIGSWFGDVGPDWHSFQTEWGRFHPDANPVTLGPNMNNSCTAARIAHVFDLRGPVSSYDTACSASLVAANAAHLLMFDSPTPREDNAEHLVVGINTLLGPGSFIGNCMASMLSHVGRSFTFNRSADGYQRGEGCGSIFIKLFQGTKKEEEERVAALIGTATNQDGRSASLTAPNGPAQQAVIKKSMAFAGINPMTVSIAECHGTGTALGDPIEVGALQAVMQNREFPLLMTSAKSALGHLEAGAGISGLTKCIMMCNMCTAPPNAHINIINPHLNTESFPVVFDTEDMDTGYSSVYCGVSSFGFGGTNSRADVYGYASKGHRSVIKYDLPVANPPKIMPIGQDILICGTWTAMKEYEEMDRARDGQTYKCAVVLGETCQERFFLSCTEDTDEAIHPVVDNSGPGAQIIGPDWDGKKFCWLLDGRRDNGIPGDVYEITFKWTSEKKTMTWEKLEDKAAVDNILGYDFDHAFYLSGSFRKWHGYTPMTKISSSKDDGDVWQGQFKIGYTAAEEFQIVRDEDKSQVLYPAMAKCQKASIPICGPDGNGKGKNWYCKGPQQDVVTVTLTVKACEYNLRIRSTGRGEMTFMDWTTWAKKSYPAFHMTGTFNEGQYTVMTPSAEPGVHTGQLALDEQGTASFQIVMNEDKNLTLYPNSELLLQGPDADATNAWFIEGASYAVYRVTMNLTDPDPTQRVTWEPVAMPALT